MLCTKPTLASCVNVSAASQHHAHIEGESRIILIWCETARRHKDTRIIYIYTNIVVYIGYISTIYYI